MTNSLKPRDEKEVGEALQWALAEGKTFEVMGHGSKRGIGRAAQTDITLDISGLTGIELYEPDELILSAKAGTPIAEIEKALAAHNQELAFEPMDCGPLLARQRALGARSAAWCRPISPARAASRRARCAISAWHAPYSGRGEFFKAGGRVVKNVTGYDLPKLLAGSWGTLAVLTEITIKVLPAPETEATVVVAGLAEDAAAQAMSAAMQSAADVSGAAYLPADMAAPSPALQGANGSVTLLRIEGVGPSVEFRAERLHEILSAFGAPERLDAAASRLLWIEVRDVHGLADGNERLVWRISVPPMQGPRLLASLRDTCQARGFCDWAGGLVWLDVPHSADASAPAIRDAIPPGAGHATLIRAPEPLRASIDVFQPQPPTMAALTRRVRHAFDPLGLLNPGRMYP
jgi:glycolate oxidase FAD binding subunit